jgi:hypothetical protein
MSLPVPFTNEVDGNLVARQQACRALSTSHCDEKSLLPEDATLVAAQHDLERLSEDRLVFSFSFCFPIRNTEIENCGALVAKRTGRDSAEPVKAGD